MQLLVRGRFELDLVLGGDLFHDLAESSGLAIFASSGEIDRRENEGVRERGLLSSLGLDTRASIGTPGGSDGLVTRLSGRGQRWEGFLGVGVEDAVAGGSTRLNRGVVDQTGEGVGSTFEFVPPL